MQPKKEQRDKLKPTSVQTGIAYNGWRNGRKRMQQKYDSAWLWPITRYIFVSKHGFCLEFRDTTNCFQATDSVNGGSTPFLYSMDAVELAGADRGEVLFDALRRGLGSRWLASLTSVRCVDVRWPICVKR